MSNPRHPKCGKTYPGGDRAGHCATCCETFIGLSTFDAHLSRDEAGKYTHLDPSTAPEKAKWWKDERGYWHKGARLTEEQKAKMFGGAQ
jgi:hypothetical protein